MFYTVYKTTNKINNKIYIGTHKTKNINDHYLGSGTLLKRDIKRYGICRFKKEILFIFDNSEEMFLKEADLVDKNFLCQINVYNLVVGGHGGWSFINENKIPKFLNRHHSKESIQLIREKASCRPPPSLETRRKLSINNPMHHKNVVDKVKGKLRGKKKSTITKNKLKESLLRYYQHCRKNNISLQNISEETRNKMCKSQQLRRKSTQVSEETKEKIRKSALEKWKTRPRIMSEEAKQKISNANKGQIPWNKGKRLKNSVVVFD